MKKNKILLGMLIGLFSGLFLGSCYFVISNNINIHNYIYNQEKIKEARQNQTRNIQAEMDLSLQTYKEKLCSAEE